MPTYTVTGGPDGTAGLNYKDKRAEPGDEVSDLPRESIKWLKEQGYIAPVGADDSAPADSVSADPGPEADASAVPGEA